MEKKIEKDGLILSEDGKVVLGVTDNTITRVVIPDGVEKIEDWAFKDCHQLQILKLPKSLKRIGFGAFTCTKLEYVSFPEGVEEIEESAFFNSSRLTTVTLPSTLKVLQDAFMACPIMRIFMMVRDLDSLKQIGQKDALSNNRIPWGFSFREHTKLYVPSDLVNAYKLHPVFGAFGHIEDITKADYSFIGKSFQRLFDDIDEDIKRGVVNFIKEEDGWYIDHIVKEYFPEDLKVTDGLGILCEAFSYDGKHAEIEFTLSDDLDCLYYYEGGLAICKKASETKGADYILDLPFMKEHKWQFWLSPDALSAIEKFPKYMKIMPQHLNKEKLDILGINTEDK